MKSLKFITIGFLFGILLVKAEVVSWYRIQEMFLFQNVHMFGIIGLAIAVGILSIQILKRFNIKSIKGEDLNFKGKLYLPKSRLVGGIIFGLGWALTGACPGPLYALLGAGNTIIILPIIFALIGALLYGVFKDKLPH